tara:strand:- start:1201 stop:1689 length:489 start_codon:yes stop_codon:yes gene_type:complete
MPNIKTASYLKLIFITSLISIIFAYFVEHVLGHQPCNLCLIERIPYGLSIILIITYFIFRKNEKLIILLLILIFIFSFSISIYHFGIEQGFFDESAICGLKNGANVTSKEELLKLLNEKTISCKDVTFKFFGLSLTSINMFLSLILTILLITIYRNNEKIRK